ncbi:MAG: hypothetical protein SOU08_08410 [Anaerococcus sp.]|nr:hypothetical protein [Peptoniphilaceae bacterium]MDY2919639.1 hypothetical protein [Anaerococcus sp.]
MCKCINHQYAVFKKGGTDMGNIYKSLGGVIGISLAIPVRYMHSSYTTANIDDIDNAIRLVKLIAENLNEKEYERIIKEL